MGWLGEAMSAEESGLRWQIQKRRTREEAAAREYRGASCRGEVLVTGRCSLGLVFLLMSCLGIAHSSFSSHLPEKPTITCSLDYSSLGLSDVSPREQIKPSHGLRVCLSPGRKGH